MDYIWLGTDSPYRTEIRDAKLIFCVYNSIEHVLPYKFDYVFIDEAHKIFKPRLLDRSRKTQPYIYQIQNDLKYRYLFNFSATLNQADLDYKYSMQEAIDDKVVVDYKLNIIIQERGKTKFDHIANYANQVKGKKCLIYCNSLLSCQMISELLGCQYISGLMGNTERQTIIADFRDNKKFLASCRTLAEGIDYPFIDAVLFAEERNSQTDIIQCIGRAQRMLPGKSEANVYVMIQYKGGEKQGQDSFADIMFHKLKKYCRVLYEYDHNVKDKLNICVFYGDKCHPTPQQRELEKEFQERVFLFMTEELFKHIRENVIECIKSNRNIENITVPDEGHKLPLTGSKDLQELADRTGFKVKITPNYINSQLKE